NGPAPSGGAVVSLATDQSAAVAVPAILTIPVGATSASVALTTQPVAVAATANVTATYAGVTRSAALVVRPPELNAVTLDLIAVLGGDPTAATVTLTGPAPPGGAAIALSSSNRSLATVPAAVT